MFRAERYVMRVGCDSSPAEWVEDEQFYATIICQDCLLKYDSDLNEAAGKCDEYSFTVNQDLQHDIILSSVCLWVELHERDYHTQPSGEPSMVLQPDDVEWLKSEE